MLPSGFEKYFWDVDCAKIDIRKNSSYIAERLLELGDIKEIAWLLKTYGEDYIKKMVEQSRNLSLKSANFYAVYFGIDPKRIICLRKDYQQQQKQIWQH